eukprot:16411647-Heterocapsa_arctica.AAC.1
MQSRDQGAQRTHILEQIKESREQRAQIKESKEQRAQNRDHIFEGTEQRAQSRECRAEIKAKKTIWFKYVVETGVTGSPHAWVTKYC